MRHERRKLTWQADPLSSQRKKGQEHIQLPKLTKALNTQQEHQGQKLLPNQRKHLPSHWFPRELLSGRGEKFLTVTRAITLHFYIHTLERIWKQFIWFRQINCLFLEEKKNATMSRIQYWAFSSYLFIYFYWENCYRILLVPFSGIYLLYISYIKETYGILRRFWLYT